MTLACNLKFLLGHKNVHCILYYLTLEHFYFSYINDFRSFEIFKQPDLPATVDELLTYLELDKYKIMFKVEEVLMVYSC